MRKKYDGNIINMKKFHTEVIILEREIYTSTHELYDVLCQLRSDVLCRGDALFRHWLPQIQRTRFVYSAWNLAFIWHCVVMTCEKSNVRFCL